MIGDILQPTHLIFILVVALLVLGPKRLPEVGRSLGRGIRDFRGAISGIDDAIHDHPNSAPPQPPAADGAVTAPSLEPVPSVESTAAAVGLAPAVTMTDVSPVAATPPAVSDAPLVATVPTAEAPEFDMSDAIPHGQGSAAHPEADTVVTPSDVKPATADRVGAHPAEPSAAGMSTLAQGHPSVHGPDPADYAD
jgi:sec-independent protein translocase protein TatA